MKDTVKALALPRGRYPRTVRGGIARGLRMQIDFAHQTRLFLGHYEVELNKYLRRILRPGMAAFDVGAQHGYDSLAIANVTRAEVAAFECDSACLDGMLDSFRLNPGLKELIQPVHAIVGIGPGKLGLDEWAFGEGFVPDFIKVDIEGAEVEALRSARQILATRKPALIVEVHSRRLEQDAGRILIDSGYRPLIVSQRRFWPDNRPTAHNRWLIAEDSSPPA